MKWIDAKDNLPNKDGAYLVCHEIYNSDVYGVWIYDFFTNPLNEGDIGWYELGTDEYNEDFYRPINYSSGAVYWMELPDAPPLKVSKINT